MTDNEEDIQDFAEFKPQPEVGDLKRLNEAIKHADEVQTGIKKLTDHAKRGEKKLKGLIEEEIPQMMLACGYKPGDSITYGGITVKLEKKSYGNVPSASAINDEKDPDRRSELVARRNKGLEILDSIAPSLIKRKYEISLDREEVDQARSLKETLEESGVEFVEGLSVHPSTLSKWIEEKLKDGYVFSEEEDYAFGRFSSNKVKISRKGNQDE
jgi:hypothetical protein